MSLFRGLGGKGGMGTTCYRYGASWRGGWHEYVMQRDRSGGCVTLGICQTPTWHTSKGEIFHRRRRSPFSNSCHVILFGNPLLCRQERIFPNHLVISIEGVYFSHGLETCISRAKSSTTLSHVTDGTKVLTFILFQGCIDSVHVHDMPEEGFVVLGLSSVFRRETAPAEHGRSLEVATPIHTHQEKAHLKTSATLGRSTKGPTSQGIPLPPQHWRGGRPEAENHNLQEQKVRKKTSVQTRLRAKSSRGTHSKTQSPRALGLWEDGRRHLKDARAL